MGAIPVVYSGIMPRGLIVPSFALAAALAVSFGSALARAQTAVKASIAPGAMPAWEKGILPINAESYYNAIECGKQGGNPACVFWDTGLCKNTDFELAMYTPYKSVAYEVWRVVNQGKPAPQPNYAEAQRTHITVGVTPVRGSKSVLTDLVLTRGGKAVMPIARELSTHRFTFDFPALAPTSSVAIDLVGKDRTIACTIDIATLKRMR